MAEYDLSPIEVDEDLHGTYDLLKSYFIRQNNLFNVVADYVNDDTFSIDIIRSYSFVASTHRAAVHLTGTPIEGGTRISLHCKSVETPERLEKEIRDRIEEVLGHMIEQKRGLPVVDKNENVAYAERAHIGMLSAAELEVYDRAVEAFQSYDTIPCTGCNYCTGCPEGVTIPYNFQTYNQYKLSGDMDRARWEWETTIPLNGARANACIECGTCEERCPQHIKISEELKKVTALFE